MRSLRSALIDEPLAKLMAIADVWDATVQATTPKEIADALAAHVLSPGTLSEIQSGLPTHAQTAFDALVRGGGKMPVATFERRFGVIRAMGPGRLERERPWEAPVSAAEMLWYRGLVFRAFDKARGTPVESVFIPTDMLELLATPAHETASTAASVAQQQLVTPNSDLLDDVTTLVCFAQNHEVRVRADGLWDLMSRQMIGRMLRDTSGVDDAHPDRRFTFLLNLLERLGWLRQQDGRLRLVPQPVTAWLQHSPEQRRATLFNAWQNDPDWNDLARVESIELEMQHAWTNDPLRERQAVLSLLDQWVTQHAALTTADAFVAHVKNSNPDFARIDGRYDTWHIRDVHDGSFLQGFDAWDRIEGALIRTMIAKPLTWLEDARVAALPAIGTGEMRAAAFSVGADGAVTIARALAFERFQLSRIADWLETQSDGFIYVVTPRSLKRASEQGIKPQRVIEFLEEKSGSATPAKLIAAIERWADRGSEARIETAVLLRTRDAATLDAMLRLDMVKRAVLERLSPTCLAIRARDLRAVRAAIASSGITVDVARD